MGEEVDVAGAGRAGGASVAESLALAGASRAKADTYLDEQVRLARLQSQNLIEQNAFEISHLRWRRFNDQMKGALQIMVVALGLSIVIGLIVAVWNASRADGIVVEAFSVPPVFAQNGIGGDIVAGDLTNKIAAIRDFANANSLSISKSVRQDRDNDIKVEIPETGISLAQAWRYLRLWFGSERPLSGNVRMLEGGKIGLTVVSDGQIFTFTGAPRDLDALEQKAAERIFAASDPGNYVLYLEGNNRMAEAYQAAARNTALAGTAMERGGAFSLFANTTHFAQGDAALAYRRALISIAIYPKSSAGHMEAMGASLDLSHAEDALHQAQIMPSLRIADEGPAFRAIGFGFSQEYARFTTDLALGDFTQALAESCDISCTISSRSLRQAEYAARLHDLAQSRALLAQSMAMGPSDPDRVGRAQYYSAAAAGDWKTAEAAARAFEIGLHATEVSGLAAVRALTIVRPLLAVALARAGDSDGAQTAIAATALDCYDCLRARGEIAALRNDATAAQAWFARAVTAAPSIPFAFADWGEMLLAKADFDAAIAKFTLANQKGPHFADPLEMWGEALMLKNRSDLALSKFEDAYKYAPNWGRLHLKWGEALGYVGRKDEGKAQYQIASTLDLSVADKAELARDMRGQSLGRW